LASLGGAKDGDVVAMVRWAIDTAHPAPAPNYLFAPQTRPQATEPASPAVAGGNEVSVPAAAVPPEVSSPDAAFEAALAESASARWAAAGPSARLLWEAGAGLLAVEVQALPLFARSPGGLVAPAPGRAATLTAVDGWAAIAAAQAAAVARFGFGHGNGAEDEDDDEEDEDPGDDDDDDGGDEEVEDSGNGIEGQGEAGAQEDEGDEDEEAAVLGGHRLWDQLRRLGAPNVMRHLEADVVEVAGGGLGPEAAAAASSSQVDAARLQRLLTRCVGVAASVRVVRAALHLAAPGAPAVPLAAVAAVLAQRPHPEAAEGLLASPQPHPAPDLPLDPRGVGGRFGGRPALEPRAASRRDAPASTFSNQAPWSAAELAAEVKTPLTHTRTLS
jgi:hypothetical protein